MRKYLYSAILILLFCLFGSYSFAQNVSREQFSQVYAQYREKYDEYVALHDDYILSKKQYEQYKTLSSKENLQRDTQRMLVKRDEVLVLYYRSVISKMDDSMIRIPEDRKLEYIKNFTDENAWLEEHIDQYKINDSPEVLSTKSEEVDTRLQDFQDVLYKGLYYIARGKMEMYGERYNALYNDLVLLTEKIKNEQREAYKLSDDKMEIIDRWFGEINLKTQEYEKYLDQADAQILKADDKNSRGTYDGAIKILEKAMVSFKERLGYTQEIIKEIKVSESEY